VQFPPDAAALLDAVGRLLDEHVMGAVPPHLQHPVRVASHLVRLVEREVGLAPENAARERELLEELVGADVADPLGELAERLRRSSDVELDRRAWAALVEITRRDLAIAKPGHDAWEGQ
jgi:hypothetical protein